MIPLRHAVRLLAICTGVLKKVRGDESSRDTELAENVVAVWAVLLTGFAKNVTGVIRAVMLGQQATQRRGRLLRRSPAASSMSRIQGGHRDRRLDR
jgi:hypothetical protein